jgi:hypothetical protein
MEKMRRNRLYASQNSPKPIQTNTSVREKFLSPLRRLGGNPVIDAIRECSRLVPTLRSGADDVADGEPAPTRNPQGSKPLFTGCTDALRRHTPSVEELFLLLLAGQTVQHRPPTLRRKWIFIER